MQYFIKVKTTEGITRLLNARYIMGVKPHDITTTIIETTTIEIFIEENFEAFQSRLAKAGHMVQTW